MIHSLPQVPHEGGPYQALFACVPLSQLHTALRIVHAPISFSPYLMERFLIRKTAAENDIQHLVQLLCRELQLLLPGV